MSRIQDLYQRIRGSLYKTNIEQLLDKRFKNITDENYLIEKSDLKNVMSIDEYFYLFMKERNFISSDSNLQIYLTEISKQLYMQPLLLLELPMYQLDKYKLRQYLPNYDYIMNIISEKQNEANKIYHKLISSPDWVTYQELNKLVQYLSFSIPHNDSKMYKVQEQVAKHLLNLEKDTPYNYNFSLFLIKFFGYKKLREESLRDTKILICKLEGKTLGESVDEFVMLNKKTLQKITLENNRLDDEFGKVNKTAYDQFGKFQFMPKTEILAVLHTLFHEIRHQVQEKHSTAGINDSIAYYYTAFAIISRYDYETNYKCSEIEKDANFKAWEEVEKLIKTYMPKLELERIMRNILHYKLKEELEQITGMRKTKNNQIFISSSLLVQYLDEKIKNNQYIQNGQYKHLLVFYNKLNLPRRTIELLKTPLISKYKEFYFIQVNYRSKQDETKVTRTDLMYLSIDELKIIFANIRTLMMLSTSNLSKIEDRVNKYNDSNTEITANMENYYNFAIYLKNIMNELIRLYPRIISPPTQENLVFRNAIDSINDYINLINNNSLVIKKISGNSKISRVGGR